jgi:hypothetical protein
MEVIMFLSKLEVARGRQYEKHHGELRGRVEFENAEGMKIEIPLDEELSKQVVGLCSDALVRSAKHAAGNMIAEVIAEHPEAIEDQTGE